MFKRRPKLKRSPSLMREWFGGVSDTVGIVGLLIFVCVVVAGALALVRATDGDASSDITSGGDRASVTFPSDSELFQSEPAVDPNPNAGVGQCGPGRVDLLTADEEAINAVRGLRQTNVAALVIANREFLVESADLVRIGISDAQVSRILLSKEACIGDIAPDDSLPNTVCAPEQLDINTAFISEIQELQGLDEPQAELLVAARPFADVEQIATTEGVLERTITWLALNGTCLRQIQNVKIDTSNLSTCAERVDLNSASLEEVADVRGLHQLDTAEIVVSNQSSISSIRDLVDLGIDPGRVGRLLTARAACFGDERLDDALPTPTCAADDLNLNSATIIEILDTEGITHDTADLIVSNRPFVNADEVVASPGLVDSAITWFSIRGSCLGPEEPRPGLCAPGRIDIQTASLDELIQMRGIRRQSIAKLIHDNRTTIDGLEQILEIGIEPTVAGKILRSQQACFGDRLPDDELPGDTCGPLGIDLNSADIQELEKLDGLTFLQADLLIAKRPFNDPSDLLAIDGIDPKTVTSLAVIEACIEPATIE